MTEKRLIEEGITFKTFQVKRTQEAKLRIWLSNTRDEPTNPEPDVIIDGSNGGFILIKATLQEPISLVKTLRTVRRKHPDTSLSVVKWELVDGSGRILQDQRTGEAAAASTDDLYYIYASFFHA